jgi:hypothetical protein
MNMNEAFNGLITHFNDAAYLRDVDNSVVVLSILCMPGSAGPIPITVRLQMKDRMKFVGHIVHYGRARSGAAAAPVPSFFGRGQKAEPDGDDLAQLQQLFLDPRMARNKGPLMSNFIAGDVARFLSQDKPFRKAEGGAGSMGGRRLKRKPEGDVDAFRGRRLEKKASLRLAKRTRIHPPRPGVPWIQYIPHNSIILWLD